MVGRLINEDQLTVGGFAVAGIPESPAWPTSLASGHGDSSLPAACYCDLRRLGQLLIPPEQQFQPILVEIEGFLPIEPVDRLVRPG